MTPSRSTQSSKQRSGARASRTPSSDRARTGEPPGKASAGKASTRGKTSPGRASAARAPAARAPAGKAPAAKAPARGTAGSRRPGRPGTERARDEQRDEPTPRYGGGPWRVADERGEARFGRARNDDADLAELAPREAGNDDDESPSAADPELAAAEAAGEIESGGQRAGMGHGEKPHRAKQRER